MHFFLMQPLDRKQKLKMGRARGFNFTYSLEFDNRIAVLIRDIDYFRV